MFSKFFIERPVFASVLSIVIVLFGTISMMTLPVAQYPDILPPEVNVSAVYPGATADVVASAVSSPLEQVINGVDGMLYMTSTASNAGTMTLSVAFEVGSDPDQNTINVNNRVQTALAKLPQEVRNLGVSVTKRSSSILCMTSIYSPGSQYDTTFLANYGILNVIDEVAEQTNLLALNAAIIAAQASRSQRQAQRQPERHARHEVQQAAHHRPGRSSLIGRHIPDEQPVQPGDRGDDQQRDPGDGEIVRAIIVGAEPARQHEAGQELQPGIAQAQHERPAGAAYQARLQRAPGELPSHWRQQNPVAPPALVLPITPHDPRSDLLRALRYNHRTKTRPMLPLIPEACHVRSL